MAATPELRSVQEGGAWPVVNFGFVSEPDVQPFRRDANSWITTGNST